MLPARILIDCTTTYLSDLNTGIQRVVRNIIYRCERATDNLGIPCIPVVFHKGKLYTFCRANGIRSAGEFQPCGAVRLPTLQRLLDNWRTRASLLLYRSEPASVRLAWRIARLVIWTLWSLVRIVAGSVCVPISRHLTSITVARDDLLLMPDFFWKFNVAEAAERAAQAGAKVIPVVHDLIPITHPQFCSPSHIRNFESSLGTVLRSSAAVMTVSGSMNQEIHAWLSNSPAVAGKPMPTDFFYHGADFATEYGNDKVSSIRLNLRVLFTADPVYLVVGTLEPRKAPDRVLDAFERLWAEGSNLRLCYIGRVSTVFKQYRRLVTHPRIGRFLFLLHDLSDHELEYAYRHCAALIFASHVEGFGIPLIEAMHYGIPVLANDIPVFREIGQEYPIYFETYNPMSLAAAIHELERQRSSFRQPRPMTRQWLTWDESVTMFFQRALSLYERSTQGGNI